jgi:dolichyl-phosphate-mannose--protein O-mannosyl transferase
VSAAAIDLHHTIFENPYQQTRENAELGYLVIALLIVTNVLLWIIWPLLFGAIGSNEVLYKMMRAFSVILSVAEFVVMFIYARRRSYRIIIGIVGGITLLSNLFYLVQVLSRDY